MNQSQDSVRGGMAPARVPGCAKSLLLWAFAKLAFAPTAYPHLGIHTGAARPTARPRTRCHSRRLWPITEPGRCFVTGENRLSWPVGCCEGDLVVIDFRDEQADGNDGHGMLYLNNTYVQSYRIQCAALCTPPCCHGLSPHSPL